MNKLLKFSSPTCAPCKMLSNYLNEKGVEYEEIDVFEQVETSSKYGISGVPVLMVVDEEGNTVDQVVGFNPPAIDELLTKI